MSQDPRQRDLAQRHASRLGDLAPDSLGDGHVRAEVVAAEDGLAEGDAVATPVARGIEAGRGGEGAREQAVAERAVAHDPDAFLETVREGLVLLAPVEHVITHLGHIYSPRAHALGEHGTREVRDAHEADATGAHYVVQRTH